MPSFDNDDDDDDDDVGGWYSGFFETSESICSISDQYHGRSVVGTMRAIACHRGDDMACCFHPSGQHDMVRVVVAVDRYQTEMWSYPNPVVVVRTSEYCWGCTRTKIAFHSVS